MPDKAMGPVRISSGFNLYVDTTFACNASCPFCIAPTKGRRESPEFFDGLIAAFRLTSFADGTIQIVGGEPCISPRLPRIIHEAKRFGFRRSVLNTNGTQHPSVTAWDLTECGFTHVNISRHHCDEEQNQEVMRFRKPVTNKQVVARAHEVIDAGMTLRMNCNLIKGHIDSVPKMVRYIRWCRSFGCENVSFSQVFPLGQFDYQVPIEPGYAEAVQIDLREIVYEIESCGQFIPSPAEDTRPENSSAWGSSGWGGSCDSPKQPKKKKHGRRRFWLHESGVEISLKTIMGYDDAGLPSRAVYRKDEDWELKDGYVAFAVVHPDGLVTASWDRSERWLLHPETTILSNLEDVPCPKKKKSSA